MKVAYQSLVDFLESSPSIDELSAKLFQLGHEHEIIEDNIFDMEITPNRGDCLSVIGLLRDLSLFYNINLDTKIYNDDIENFSLEFHNNAIDSCSNISFLKVEIENEILPYSGKLKDYFDLLEIKQNNFFTDISNYILYEMGQPTHCYDASKINSKLTLDFTEVNTKFRTLADKEINLEGKNLVFSLDSEIINLAGIVGGKNTACSNKTRSVIIECANFNPEDIIGKSVKYDIQSDAAFRFERGVDPLCHNLVLRRFIKIIQDYAQIKNIEIFKQGYKEYKKTVIANNPDYINKIIGTELDTNHSKILLSKLGFKFNGDVIEVPSYRNDVKNQNDLAEEIARSIGYDNIPIKEILIPDGNEAKLHNIETAVKSFLNKNGFYEVINDPFVPHQADSCIKVDNPLDSNRTYLRTNLKKSLIENLLYNERRQKDSIKLFEISHTYPTENLTGIKKTLGIIASGRLGKNYIDFTKKVSAQYLDTIIGKYIKNNLKFEDIPRYTLSTKIKDKISYIEIELDQLNSSILSYEAEPQLPAIFTKYRPISEYPSSARDLSFSIKNFSNSRPLQDYILNFKHELIKDIFIFDFFHNNKNDEIKIGFRFIFQANNSTITESQVKDVIDKIIEYVLSTYDVSVPGL